MAHPPPPPPPPPSSPIAHDEDDLNLALSAKDFLQSVIDRFVVVICASVRVQYQGRASSVANLSPRIVITKPDGTLIIHEDTKHRPLNWQPPGTKFYLSIDKDSVLVLEAFRKKDRETVTLWFDRLHYIAASRITPGKFRFVGSESEMVDLIFERPDLIEPGFTPERREHRTRSGTVDLIGRDKDGNLLVLEFKRRQAQLSSASQLDRYVEHMTEMESRGAEERRRQSGSRRDGKLEGVGKKRSAGERKGRWKRGVQGAWRYSRTGDNLRGASASQEEGL